MHCTDKRSNDVYYSHEQLILVSNVVIRFTSATSAGFIAPGKSCLLININSEAPASLSCFNTLCNSEAQSSNLNMS